MASHFQRPNAADAPGVTSLHRRDDAETTPDISVVIPVGRIDRFLGRQVRAVLTQTPPFAFDVVISLNSRADADRAGLADVVRVAADPRLRTVSSADRRGAAHARNVGASDAGAPLLAFCDADDEVKPGWLEALVQGLEANDAVCGRMNELAPPRQVSWRPPATPGRLPTFLGVPYVLSGNLGITRRAFVAVGGFDETLTRCEDIALGWTLLHRGYTIGFVEEAVVDYHHRPGLPALLRQYYLYGRGMAEVVSRYRVPAAAGGRQLTGLARLRPNRQPAPLTIVNVLRRGSIAAGRVVGLVSEWRRRPDGPGTSR
jgi:GT2 family glycosyltransferase